MKNQDTKQWYSAPESNGQAVNGALLGVSLSPGERVEWVFTILPDGKQIVTGYDILPTLPPVPEESPAN